MPDLKFDQDTELTRLLGEVSWDPLISNNIISYIPVMPTALTVLGTAQTPKKRVPSGQGCPRRF